MSDPVSPLDILEFWWTAGPSKWWSRNDKFDAVIAEKFGATYEAAIAGDLDGWSDSVDGALALIILLDQFSRNLNRQSAQAFAHDDKALALSRQAVDRGYDRAFPEPACAFFYMPMMHAEDMDAQEQCVDLCRVKAQGDNYRAALEHMDIIRRFGRFPHRNAVLGRQTTDAERRFLEAGGFKG